MADVDLKFSSPEMRVNINRDKAGTMGASVRDVPRHCNTDSADSAWGTSDEWKTI